MKIFFIVYEGWPGVATALKSIKKITDDSLKQCSTEIIYISEKLDYNILRKVQVESPDYIFLGGWDNNIKTIVQNVPRPQTRIGLIWCSPVTQIDLGGEIPRFLDVWQNVQNGLIKDLFVMIESDYHVLREANMNVSYLPLYMDEDQLSVVEPDLSIKEGQYLDCDLFCAPCSRKNILSQMIALSLFEGVKIHINYNPSPMSSLYIAASRIFASDRIMNHSWMNREQYLRTVAAMDFGCQITLSESFNYTAAEHMYFGVPVLMSVASPLSSAKEMKPLIIENHNDMLEIKSKIHEIMFSKKFRDEMSEICKEHVLRFNARSKTILIENLVEVFNKERN